MENQEHSYYREDRKRAGKKQSVEEVGLEHSQDILPRTEA